MCKMPLFINGNDDVLASGDHSIWVSVVGVTGVGMRYFYFSYIKLVRV